MSLEPKLRSWRFLRYWRFNKRYHGGYQLICLISWPILISSRRDWYRSKRSLQGLSVAIETVRIIKELVEIWLNEVCDSMKKAAWSVLSQLPSSHVWSRIHSRRGFHPGLWPGLIPLLILCFELCVEISPLCSSSTTICEVADSVVCQVTMLPSFNSL